MRFGSTSVKLSNVTKVLYPAAGFTKGEMIGYYLGMADFILPHLSNQTKEACARHRVDRQRR